MARLVALGSGGEIGSDAFTGSASAPSPPRQASGDDPAAAQADASTTLRQQLEALERSVIAKTMTAVGGNQSEAARRLDISRNTLTERLRRYEIAPEFDAGSAP